MYVTYNAVENVRIVTETYPNYVNVRKFARVFNSFLHFHHTIDFINWVVYRLFLILDISLSLSLFSLGAVTILKFILADVAEEQ